MKKIISIICAAVMALSATGCSKKSESSDIDTQSQTSSQKVGKPKIPKIEKSVIWETDNIRVSTEYFKRIDIGLKLKIENKSKSELLLDVNEFYINDFKMSGLLYSTIPAGETVYDTINFSDITIEEANITEIGQVEICFSARNKEGKDFEYSDPIIIETEFTDWKKNQDLGQSELLYDNEDIKITAKSIKNTAYMPNVLPVIIENNTGQEINAKFTWAAVNGKNVDLVSKFRDYRIQEGKKILFDIDVDEIMEESKEDSLESLEINFDIDIGEKDKLRTDYLLIKDVSGYKQPTEGSKEEE